MSRSLVACGCVGAFGVASLLIGTSLRGQEPADEGPAAETTAAKAGAQQQEDDVHVRFAKASLRVAEAELAQAQEANRKLPGTMTQGEIRRLALMVERSRVAVEVAQAAGKTPAAAAGPAVRLTDTAAAEAILRGLEQKTSFDFNEKELKDVVKFFADKHTVPIMLDLMSLSDAGIDSSTPITQQAKDISLRSALNLLLKEHDLTYVIRDDVLLITTKDEANNLLEIVVYDVRDLLDMDRQDRSAAGNESSQDDFQSLIDIITTTVHPTTWDSVGGPGSMGPIYGTLVVSQTQQVHEEIAKLLAALRKTRAARGEKANPMKAADDKPAAPVDANGLSLRIHKVQVPLLLIRGSAAAGAPAKPAATGGAGVSGQFGGGQPQASGVPDPDFIVQLAGAITATIQPESWDVQGGPGAIRTLPADSSGQAALVVRQTTAVQQQIERFLKELQTQGIPSPGASGGGLF